MNDTNETIVAVYPVDAHVWLKWKYGFNDVYIVTEIELSGIKPNDSNHCAYCVNKSQKNSNFCFEFLLKVKNQMDWIHLRFVNNWFDSDCIQWFSPVESFQNYYEITLSNAKK